MGVADNRSYKDEYLFTDDVNYDTGKDQPSIHQEPKINSTIKENPYRSNVEIEGGEMVLQPDLTAIFKAKGPRHSGGGMDVLLKPESFIFSDYKGLEFKDKDFKLFELKEGGTNTPAQVLKKNVDPKHYNTLVNILDDPYKDDLAKKSAARMLEKYIQSLGNIAYVQEEKKGFPQGLPAFSMGTAPVYDDAIKNDIDSNKQYMKAGGTTRNPYMQQAGVTPWYPEEEPKRNYSTRSTIPWMRSPDNPTRLPLSGTPAPYTGIGPQQQFDYPMQGAYGNQYGTPSWYPQKEEVRNYSVRPTVSVDNSITPPPQNPATVKVAAAKAAVTPDPWGLWQGDKMPIFQDRYGMTNAADKFDDLKNWDDVATGLGYTGPKSNLEFQKWLYNSSPENKAIIDKWHATYSKGPNAGMFDKKIGIRWANAIRDIRNKPKPNVPMPGYNPPPVVPKNDVPGPKMPELQITPQGSKQADWRFTPWQKLSQLNQAAQYANVKRYMPYRSRYNATYVDPALVNPEQAVGDIKGLANQQISSLRTLNPILRNAQAASISGQAMNQVPGVRTQYDNQNAQILNQTRQYNNQVKNNESLVNLGFDQQYYRESIEGRKNFDNMRSFTWNNYMNNIFRDVESNQKLSYNLLTLNNPAYGYDWKTGNFTRNQKNILDSQSNAVNERYNDMLKMIDSITDPTAKVNALLKLEGIKTFGAAQQTPNPLQKKGGRVGRNPYKK